MALFGRRCAVQVDTLLIEGLDVRFAVEMAEKTYGKAEITIFNLNADHRQALEAAKSVDVELRAGYIDEDLTTIFKGTLRESFSQLDPPDWITTIRSGDGDKAQQARISKSFPKGLSLSSVWKATVDELKNIGVGAGNAIAAFANGEFNDGVQKLLSGGVLQGSAWEALKKQAASANLDVDIQGGELIVTPKGLPLETTAIVLSPSTGLVGSPQKGAKGLLKARALIVPGLLPKRKVDIRSSLISGLYQVSKAKYTGDTYGNDWYVDLECKEVG